MHVIAIGHSTVKRIQPPGLSDAYDRYELKLDPVNSSRLKESADAVLFLNWDVRVTENAEGRVRGVGGKERMIYTTHSAAYDAKNRVGLPEKLKCEFAALTPLLGASDAPQSQPQAPEGLSRPSVKEQLANALADVDREVLSLFFRNKKGWKGTLEEVPDDYAQKVLSNLPKFRQTLEQFAKEPF